MTVLDLQVSAGADDGGSQNFGTTWSSTADVTAAIGNENSFGFDVAQIGFARFTGVSGLSGADVDVAEFSVYISSFAGTGTLATRIHAESAASPAAPTSRADQLGRSLTTASVSWAPSGSTNQWYTAPTIVSLIEELAGTFNPDAIQIHHVDNGTSGARVLRWRTYEFDTDLAPRLYLEFTPSNTPPDITVGPTVSYINNTNLRPDSTPATVTFTVVDAEEDGSDELNWAIYTATARGGTLVASGTCTSGVEEEVFIEWDDAGIVEGSQTLYLVVDDGTDDAEESFNLIVSYQVDVALLGEATLAADGDLSIEAGIPQSGEAAIAAEGDVTVIAEVPATGDAAIDTTGDVVISPSISGDAAIAAEGNLSVTIIISVEPSGNAAIAAEGNLTIVNVAVLGGEAAIDADGVLHITADIPATGEAAIAAQGDVSIAPAISADAAIAAEGDVTISPQISADAAVAAEGDLGIDAAIPQAGDAAIAAEGDLSLSADIPPSGNAAIAATGDLSVELTGFEIRGHRIRAEFETAQGAPIGAGPVIDIPVAGYGLELDHVGTFEVEVPAFTEFADEIVNGAGSLLFREGEGQVYHGIVQTPRIIVTEEPTYQLQVTGDSVARELVWRNTLTREYSNQTIATIVNDLLSGTGWTANIASDSRTFTIQLNGLSVWAALVKIANMAGWHVRENNLERTIDVGAFGDDSGLIFENVEHIEPGMSVVPIRSLELASEQQDLWNRVVPYGGGDGINVLTLRHSNRNSPYTIQSATGPDGQTYWYIEDGASVAAHGERTMPLSINDVVPLSNSTAEIRNAANALYDIAAAWLGWHSQAYETYQLTISGMPHYVDDVPRFKVGDVARLTFRGVMTLPGGDTLVWKDIDTDVYILGFERRFSPEDLNEWQLTVSTTSHQAPGDAEAIAQAIDELWAVQTSKRPYTYQDTHGPYVESVNSGNNARFLVRFDSQVTYLHRAMLIVRKRQVKSNVTGAAAGGGQTSSAGGGQTSSSDGAHTHSINAVTSQSGGGQTSSGGTAHSHTVSGQSAVLGGDHHHQLAQVLAPGDWETQPFQQQVVFSASGGGFHGVYVGRGSDSTGGPFLVTQTSGQHTHTVSGTTSSSESSHTHQVSAHTHQVSGQTAQSGGAHTHTVSNHTHTVQDHTHSLVYGIFLGPTANTPAFNVVINGTNRTAALGGSWNNNFEVDITPYLVDGQGHVLRQQNNIDITSSQLCDVEVTVKTFVTAHSIVPV